MEKKKFLDEKGMLFLYNKLNNNDYPNNETLIAVLDAIDNVKADKDNPDFTGEPTIEGNPIATRDYVDIATKVQVYRNATEIPLTKSMQIIFYASCGGTMTFNMLGVEFSKTLESSDDTGWYLWVQTDDISGSFISPAGTRTYMNMGGIAETAEISFTPSDNRKTYSYIIITN